jgi:nitrate/nitrite transporter NarK
VLAKDPSRCCIQRSARAFICSGVCWFRLIVVGGELIRCRATVDGEASLVGELGAFILPLKVSEALLVDMEEVAVCVTVCVTVFVVVKVGEDTIAGARCGPARLDLGESMRCRRLDMLSYSLRGDLGD